MRKLNKLPTPQQYSLFIDLSEKLADCLQLTEEERRECMRRACDRGIEIAHACETRGQLWRHFMYWYREFDFPANEVFYHKPYYGTMLESVKAEYLKQPDPSQLDIFYQISENENSY